QSGRRSGFPRQHRILGPVRLTDKWVYGWDGTLITDRSYFQDYGLYRHVQQTNLLASTPDFVVSQAYLQGRGARRFFDIRPMYFSAFSAGDTQPQIPVIHPTMDHDYTFNQPILGGALSLHSNLTSLSRENAFFDPINQTAATNGFCNLNTADSS